MEQTAASPPMILRITNQTVDALSVRTTTARIAIPPLGRAEISDQNVDREALVPAECAGIIAIKAIEKRARPPELIPGAIAMLAFAVGVAWLFEFAVWLLLPLAALTALVVWRFVQLGWLRLRRLRRVLRRVRDSLMLLLRRLRELAYLVGVVLIVVAVPGMILYFGSDVAGLVDIARDETNPDQYAATVALIGIGMKELCIVGASALPVLLYFVFDREKLQTLREKFIRHVFRLDPAVKTIRDIETKYGGALDETYGRQSDNRFLPGTRSPILLATAVITLGWTVALLDTNTTALLPQSPKLTALLTPTASPATFAFLGAYFFTLNSVLRAYVRGDLRPKTYANVAARIVTVAVLAFVLERLVRGLGGQSSSASLLVLAFIAGVVPETVLVRLQEVARGLATTSSGRTRINELTRTYESDPLTQLDGIDIYDRARLLDEGVSNVEGLAHHDVVDLLLKTRIPAPRVVDWVDQAILYIHCSEADPDADSRADTTRPTALRRLRCHGIRTATDLESAYQASVPEREDAFLSIVPTRKGEPPRLRTIIEAVGNEDWMPSLRNWRANQQEPALVMLPESCEIKRTRRARRQQGNAAEAGLDPSSVPADQAAPNGGTSGSSDVVA